MKLVFDLEADGLLRGNKISEPVSKIWMIVARDVTTEKEYIFCDYYNAVNGEFVKPLNQFARLFNRATELIGHNIILYDLPVLKKILGWVPSENTTIRDTMLMSQVLNYDRFGGVHNLHTWGLYLGFPKPEHEDWSKYSPEMMVRCRDDVTLSLKVYRVLARELTNFLKSSKHPDYMKTSLRVEHVLAEFQAQATEHGWVFDMKAALALEKEMAESLKRIREEIEPDMPMRLSIIDKEAKNPEYKKNGEYMQRTVKHFGLPVEDALYNETLQGSYQRIEYLSPDINSMEYTKEYLYSLGWEPLDWNWEKNVKTGEFQKKSPKLCEESLKAIGHKGELINEYFSTRSRLGILQGWINSVDEDGRLRGDMFTIATPTGRARHKIIVNVPSPKASWGAQMRSLFGCPEGYKVVGSDSAGNQFRALCHYIKDPDFTETVINGDIHQKNADILGCDRPTAKPWIYAFLFGAGFEKLGLILTGVRNKKAGQDSKKKFASAIPGFKALVKKLEEIVYASKAKDDKASIPALDGRRIYLDSAHKALNYLLQSAEGITCKAAVAYAWDKFKEEGIEAIPLIFYHDEMQWAIPEHQAERAAEICAEAFREAPKWYGVTCMDGEAMVGNNWYETH